MEQYVSIIVPYFNRINYLKELIDSAHKYADMPFELIIHDDASIDGSTPELFNLRDKLSSLIINNGHNIGLSASVNRLVNMASSNYIIFLNCDCAFINPCFKNIYEILSRPYVGFIHIANVVNPYEPDIRDTKFCLVGLQSGSALAFRKDVWREVGGWHNVHSGAADVAFILSIFNRGYFGTNPFGKKYVSNLSYERVQSQDSSMGMSGFDCSHPKIFGLSNYDRECQIREQEFHNYADSPSLRTGPAGFTNIDYWHNYIMKLLFTNQGDKAIDRINWEIAKVHGHDRWKADVLKDKDNIR